MKKLILIVIFACCVNVSSSQPNPTEDKYVFARMTFYGGVVKDEVLLNFGMLDKYYSKTLLRDAKGKKIKFRTLMDAMSYMSIHGWEFVQADSGYWIIRRSLYEMEPAERRVVLTKFGLNNGGDTGNSDDFYDEDTEDYFEDGDDD